MDFKNLQRKAMELINKRGGTESAKQDAEELKDIATGPGSLGDKAKAAADALKDPGAPGPDRPAGATPGAPGDAEPQTPAGATPGAPGDAEPQTPAASPPSSTPETPNEPPRTGA
jgi:hypothetical protein